MALDLRLLLGAKWFSEDTAISALLTQNQDLNDYQMTSILYARGVGAQGNNPVMQRFNVLTNDVTDLKKRLSAAELSVQSVQSVSDLRDTVNKAIAATNAEQQRQQMLINEFSRKLQGLESQIGSLVAVLKPLLQQFSAAQAAAQTAAPPASE